MGGGQNKRGGFEDFEKLISGGGQNKRGGWGQNRKEMKMVLSLSTLLTSLNISISSILRSRLH